MPVQGASRRTCGATKSSAAFPSCVQVKKMYWWLPSIATQSTATAGTPHVRDSSQPAASANAPLCRALTAKKATKSAAATGGAMEA